MNYTAMNKALALIAFLFPLLALAQVECYMPEEIEEHKGTWLQWPQNNLYDPWFVDGVEPTFIAMTSDLQSSGNVLYVPQEIDLVEFCNELIERFNSIQVEERILDFEIIRKPCNVALDPQLVAHSLSNLVSNAFKYSVGNKNPLLTINFKPKEILLSVKDYGLGIPKAELSNLFQPFFSANNVTEIKGAGLGLNIAKEYAEYNKGQIAVKSKLGEDSSLK
tara:strand:+ start:177 stop:839 length:663 start_codon:yes stop_codon:yes gene_type:complete